MYKRALLLLLVPLFLFLLAPAPAEGRSAGHMFEVYTGGASFYSDRFQGRKTANGERYDKKALTAAHRSLPMGTIVRVTSLSTGKHLLVRINDRGPVKKKWIIDVSREAATRLHMVRKGVINVQVEVVADSRGVPVQKGNAFFLRLTNPRSKAAAERTLQQYVGKKHSRMEKARLFREGTSDRYFVGIGPFSRYKDAMKAYNQLHSAQADPSIVCMPVALASAL